MGEEFWTADMCITGTETKLSALQTSSPKKNKKKTWLNPELKNIFKLFSKTNQTVAVVILFAKLFSW